VLKPNTSGHDEADDLLAQLQASAEEQRRIADRQERLLARLREELRRAR
jgi:hypothetical protein